MDNRNIEQTLTEWLESKPNTVAACVDLVRQLLTLAKQKRLSAAMRARVTIACASGTARFPSELANRSRQTCDARGYIMTSPVTEHPIATLASLRASGNVAANTLADVVDELDARLPISPGTGERCVVFPTTGRGTFTVEEILSYSDRAVVMLQREADRAARAAG